MTTKPKGTLDQLIQAVADTSFAYGELEHNTDDGEHYRACETAQTNLRNYLTQRYNASDSPVALPVSHVERGPEGYRLLLDATGMSLGVIYGKEFADFLLPLLNNVKNPSVPISGIDNETRAEFGERAIANGNPDHEIDTDPEDKSTWTSSVSDTLANIMHFCQREEIAWEPRLTMAEINFNEECDEENDEPDDEPDADSLAFDEQNPPDSPSLEDTTFDHADPRNR